ncbi:hypothetical protein [Undibacterium crateris]|uniref:hypothetical protein n=1 Tax=Undibacterium crateris TaxID=2528175 RepID=UPI0013894847|nr:hypothetical protein [Undibacterium crateris]NDI85116.1 hypothetical protein [Undibacterium crateris]
MWDIERVSKGFDELTFKGFMHRCKRTSWVFIQHYLKWNQFENPNVGIAAGKMFDAISPPNEVKAMLAKALRAFSSVFPVVKLDNFEEKYKVPDNPLGTLSDSALKPEPEPEPEPESNKNNVELKPDDVSTIFDFWKKVMDSPRSALDSKRKGLIRSALKSYSPSDICLAIRGCSKTPHNMGKNTQGVKYNGLDVILKSGDNIDRFIRNDKELSGQMGGSRAETIEEKNARIEREFLGSPDVTGICGVDAVPALEMGRT